jgi:hypothetical protein
MKTFKDLTDDEKELYRLLGTTNWSLPITVHSANSPWPIYVESLELERTTSEQPKPEWIDVPAHRIYKVATSLFQSEFELYDHNGNTPPEPGAEVYFIYRKRDRKRFKAARFVPQNWSNWQRKIEFVYLEEV